VIGNRKFYTYKYETTTILSEKRMIYIYLNIPDDIKSLYMFCFSTLANLDIAENQPFRDFMAIINEFKSNWLNAYDEILYRNFAKSWIYKEYSHHIEAELSKAIADESIEEIKEAIQLRPHAWEPHYLLAKECGEKYFLGYKVDYMSVPGGVKQKVMMPQYSSRPIDVNAAIREYKYLIDLNPNFNLASKWTLIRFQQETASRPNLEEVYRGIAKSYASIEKYDEAIFYLEEGIKKIPSEKYLRNDLMGVYETSAVKNVAKEDWSTSIDRIVNRIKALQN
jgi:tetratricopeptide (TPR) repeat protein